MELREYFQPTGIEQALELLAAHTGAKVLAGGTDLVIEMHKKDRVPEYLVDIGHIPELKTIVEEKGQIIIGSMVTFTQLKDSRLIQMQFNSIYECAKHMGSPQIRNTATIGGNIVNAGSAADITPCVMAHDGILVFESASKKRKISCVDYFRNYEQEKITNGELLTKIILPIGSEQSGYYKLGKRNSLAISRLNAAISIKLEAGVVKAMSVALGAVGRYPFRSTKLENYGVGKTVEELVGEVALKILEDEVYESIKGRKTMPFKKEAVKGVYKEALRIALEAHHA